MGFGVFVIGPVTQWLIAISSWRTASLVLGIGSLTLLLPLVLWAIRDPAPVDADGRAGEPTEPLHGYGANARQRALKRAWWKPGWTPAVGQWSGLRL